jgi:competence protein ComEC
VSARLVRGVEPHWTVGSLCAGLVTANALRARGLLLPLLCIAALTISACASRPVSRLALVCLAAALAGVTWGSARLDAIDRSPMRPEIGRAGRAVVEITTTPRRGSFDVRAFARLLRFEGRSIHEPVLLRLPLGRAPPLGSRLAILAEIKAPRPSRNGFDEATYLRRHGIHVVLRVDAWRRIGQRGGLGGLADRLHRGLTAALASGTSGERRLLLVGVVLGDDGGVPEKLRDRFRASGLYHLLAVSGQNVALLTGGVLGLAGLLGIGRVAAELGALCAIGAYVLAVGAQPSVVRAGVAGALGSLAWLTARERDKWYFLLLGAVVLLAWSPYNALDPGFQLSFAAVAAIFVLAARLERWAEGYPIPDGVRKTGAVSAACGLATLPIVCLQFGSFPLYTLPANLLAEPAMPPLLALSFAAVALHPVSAAAGAVPAWLAGWCAAYIAGCARMFGGLPFARLPTSLALTLVSLGAAAYAWQRWRRAI